MTYTEMKDFLIGLEKENQLMIVKNRPTFIIFEKDELTISLYEDEISFSCFFGRLGSIFCCYKLDEIDISTRVYCDYGFDILIKGKKVFGVQLDARLHKAI